MNRKVRSRAGNSSLPRAPSAHKTSTPVGRKGRTRPRPGLKGSRPKKRRPVARAEIEYRISMLQLSDEPLAELLIRCYRGEKVSSAALRRAARKTDEMRASSSHTGRRSLGGNNWWGDDG